MQGPAQPLALPSAPPRGAGRGRQEEVAEARSAWGVSLAQPSPERSRAAGCTARGHSSLGYLRRVGQPYLTYGHREWPGCPVQGGWGHLGRHDLPGDREESCYPTQHSQAFPLRMGPWLPMDQALAPAPLNPVFGSQTGSSGGPPGPGGKRPSGEHSAGYSHPKSHRTGTSQTLAATSGLASPGLRRLLRGGTCRGTAGSSGSRSSMQTHPSACPSLQGCTDQSQN